MSSLQQLADEYRALSSGLGAETALQLSNAIITAERLESNRHWGVFADNHELKTMSRLKAWQLVAKKRGELEDIVFVQMFTIVKKMEAISETAEEVERYKSDLVLKSGILHSLGRGLTTQDETFTLLAAWAASPIQNDS